jgi:hypothetical protein
MKTKSSKKAAEKTQELQKGPLFSPAMAQRYIRADYETRFELLAELQQSNPDPDHKLTVGVLRAVENAHARELAQARENNPIVIELSYGQEDQNGRWIRDNDYTDEKGREYLREQRAELEKKLSAIAQQLEANPEPPPKPPEELRDQVMALPEKTP